MRAFRFSPTPWRWVRVFGGLACVMAMGFPATARADGFATPHTLPFKLNSSGLAVQRESLRANLNASGAGASSGAGDSTGQANSNMANVIQVTENYEIILNGSGNTVTTQAGKLDSVQDGTELTQRADNEIRANNQTSVTTTSSGSGAVQSSVLNP